MSSAEAATEYVRRMVAHETRGWGDQSGALNRIEQRYGLPFWTLDNLRKGRAKTVEAGLFARIRAAYLTMCESGVRKLQHEIAIERAKGPHDDADGELAALEAEADALAAKIAARKRAQGR